MHKVWNHVSKGILEGTNSMRIQRKEKLMKAGSGGEGFWQEVEKKKNW